MPMYRSRLINIRTCIFDRGFEVAWGHDLSLRLIFLYLPERRVPKKAMLFKLGPPNHCQVKVKITRNITALHYWRLVRGINVTGDFPSQMDNNAKIVWIHILSWIIPKWKRVTSVCNTYIWTSINSIELWIWSSWARSNNVCAGIWWNYFRGRLVFKIHD